MITLILNRHLTEKILKNRLNDLKLKYPHFSNALLQAQDGLNVQLDYLYANNPTDLQVYAYLVKHDITLADLEKILPYHKYRILHNELT